MSNRFDFEQQIMICWNVVEDIDAVVSVSDTLSTDELQNALIGIKTLYQIKFDKLWELFEDSLKPAN